MIPVLAASALLAPAAANAVPTPWNFTVKVGLSADLVNEYGGLAPLENQVNSQLATISSRFGGFNAPVNFSATEFYVFSDDPATELAVPHPESNFLLLYSETAAGEGGWYGGNQAVVHMWPANQGGIFAPYATDGLVHEFGHSRGAVDVYDEDISAANNPVSGQAFTAPAGIMTYPYGVTTWDPYSQGIINAGAATMYDGAPVVDASFPKMRVEVKNATGHVVSGANVTIYPEAWGSGVVSPTASQSGKTNVYGNLPLASNPFAPGTAGQPWNLAAPNFVVEATKNGHTGYGFLPLSTVGAWYFSHPGQTYTLVIKEK